MSHKYENICTRIENFNLYKYLCTENKGPQISKLRLMMIGIFGYWKLSCQWEIIKNSILVNQPKLQAETQDFLICFLLDLIIYLVGSQKGIISLLKLRQCF